jgi:hypothetical protein
MKNKTMTLIGIAALMLAMVTAKADNFASYYVNATNGVVVGATTNQANVVAAASTNTFNLSTSEKTQSDTNSWPAEPLVIQHNQYIPSRILCFQNQHQSLAASTGTYIERYAGSTDGSHWQTNPCPFVITYTEAGTAGVQIITNLDWAAMQYVCLFKRENTNAVAITNNWMGTASDRGL